VNRNAGPGELRDLAGLLEGYRVGVLGVVSVHSVHLYRSDLHPSGSVYTQLFTAHLSGNAP
jgi:2'-5' RNA ligase